METTAAKAPLVDAFEGSFETAECLPTGGGLPLGALLLGSGGDARDLRDSFAQGDVFAFDITLTFTNTDQSWGELHLWYSFGETGDYWTEPTGDGRGEVVVNFTGQGHITTEDFWANIGVDCWYGQITTPVPYRVEYAIAFAEGAVPSSQPVLVQVPEGATKLIVSGLALDGATPVTSHFRVFAPDDSLVCECGLNSNEEAAVVDLPGPGDYVVLVDHTEGGFVALALDAPPVAPLRALASRFEAFVLASSGGQAVSDSFPLDFPSTPLAVFGWVEPPGDPHGAPDVGAGRNLKMTLVNARGEVMRIAMGGFVNFHAAVPGAFAMQSWYPVGLPDDEWEFYFDHHAYAPGGHTVTVDAEMLRGDAVLYAIFYDRAS